MTAPISTSTQTPITSSKKDRRQRNKEKFQELSSPSKTATVSGDWRNAFHGTLLPLTIQLLIAEYAELLPVIPFATGRVNLLDPALLLPLFSRSFQTDSVMAIALEILKETYEAKPSKTLGKRNVFFFPICTGIYQYVLQYLRKQFSGESGKVMLELGAGRAYFSILTSFSDVRIIYVNDKESRELDLFHRKKNKLPQDVQKKFISVPGDCLFLETYSPIKDKIDLVVCQNLIHFFKPTKMQHFFSNLHRITQSGTQAIFTANAAARVTIDDTESCFDIAKCVVEDKNGNNLLTLFEGVAIPSNPEFLHLSTKALLYVKGHYKLWVKKSNLTGELREEIEEARKLHQAQLLQAPLASKIWLYRHQALFFNNKSLTDLLTNNGYAVRTIFYIDTLGHIIPEGSLHSTEQQVMQIGALCTKK